MSVNRTENIKHVLNDAVTSDDGMLPAYQIEGTRFCGTCIWNAPMLLKAYTIGVTFTFVQSILPLLHMHALFMFTFIQNRNFKQTAMNCR